jgi:hypothetical protein
MNDNSPAPVRPFVVRPLPKPRAQIHAFTAVRLKPGRNLPKRIVPLQPRLRVLAKPRRRVRVRRSILPTGLVPRLLNRDAAAAYCGISTTHFLAHVSPNLSPILIGQKRLWDVKAIDRWLDQESTFGQVSLSAEQWLERLDGDPGARR